METRTTTDTLHHAPLDSRGLRPVFDWPQASNHPLPPITTTFTDARRETALGKRRREYCHPRSKGCSTTSFSSTSSSSSSSSSSSRFSSSTSTSSNYPYSRRRSIEELLNPEHTTPPAPTVAAAPKRQDGFSQGTHLINDSYTNSDISDDSERSQGRSSPSTNYYPPLPVHFKLPTVKRFKIGVSGMDEDEEEDAYGSKSRLRCHPLPRPVLQRRRFGTMMTAKGESPGIRFVGPAISRIGRRAGVERKGGALSALGDLSYDSENTE